MTRWRSASAASHWPRGGRWSAAGCRKPPPSSPSTRRRVPRRRGAAGRGAAMADDEQPGTRRVTATATPPAEREPVDTLHEDGGVSTRPKRAELTETEQRLLSDLFAIVEEHAADAAVEID